MKLKITGIILFLLLLGTPPVSAQNNPPTADAGEDIYNILEFQSVFLNGTGSVDPDSEVPGNLTFTWTQIDGAKASIFGAGTSTPLVTVPNIPVGKDTITFKLTVTDSGGLSSIDLVDIIVHDSTGNSPPKVVTGPNQTVQSGTGVQFDAGATFDPNKDQIFFHWAQSSGPKVTLTNPYTANPHLTAPIVNESTELTFQVTATDGLLSDTASVVISVNPVPLPEPDMLVMTGEADTTIKLTKSYRDKEESEGELPMALGENEIHIGTNAGINFIKANDVSLPDLLRKIKSQSGIDFKTNRGLSKDSISVDVKAKNWTQVVQKVLKGYNRVELWGQDQELMKVIVVKTIKSKGRPLAKPSLEIKNSDTGQVAVENKPIANEDVLLRKDQL